MKSFLIVLVIFLFPNLVFWGGANYFELDRRLINIDYFSLFLCVFFKEKNVKNIFLFICLFICFFIDFYLLILQIFPFVELNEVVYLSGFLFYGPVVYRLIILSSLIIFFIIFYIIRKAIEQKSFSFFPLIFLMGMSFILGGQSYILYCYQASYKSFNQIKGYENNKLSKNRYESALFQWYSQLNENFTSNKVLFIVNESWGSTINSGHHNQILKEIYKHKSKLEYLREGEFPFIGATVAGEVRELCNKKPNSLNLSHVVDEEFKECIPNLLKLKKYETIAIHGAEGDLYARNIWYTRAGFNQQLFAKDLHQGGDCKSFSGRCDFHLTSIIQNQLIQNEKVFLYWLTLNTHAPYDDQLFVDGFSCLKSGIEESTSSCRNLKLQYQFFYSLGRLIDDPKLKGLEIIIVGDHSPPILNMKGNLFVFKGNYVPWIHLKIKD